jgi:hypothetical protein
MTNPTDICLLAIDGDRTIPDFIPIERDDVGIVRDYMANELERIFVDGAFDGKKYRTLLEEHSRLGNELMERGIFHHKWHMRTEWAPWSMLDGMPVNVDTANACYKGASQSVRMVAK